MTFHIQICHSNGILATFKAARPAFLRTGEIFIGGNFFYCCGFITVSEADWICCRCGDGKLRANVELTGCCTHCTARHNTTLHNTTQHNTGPGETSTSSFPLRSDATARRRRRRRDPEINIKMYFPRLVIPGLKEPTRGKHIHTPVQDQFVQLLSQLFIYFQLEYVSPLSGGEMVSIALLWSPLWNYLFHLLEAIAFADGCTWYLLLCGVCDSLQTLFD